MKRLHRAGDLLWDDVYRRNSPYKAPDIGWLKTQMEGPDNWEDPTWLLRNDGSLGRCNRGYRVLTAYNRVWKMYVEDLDISDPYR